MGWKDEIWKGKNSKSQWLIGRTDEDSKMFDSKLMNTKGTSGIYHPCVPSFCDVGQSCILPLDSNVWKPFGKRIRQTFLLKFAEQKLKVIKPPTSKSNRRSGLWHMQYRLICWYSCAEGFLPTNLDRMPLQPPFWQFSISNLTVPCFCCLLESKKSWAAKKKL